VLNIAMSNDSEVDDTVDSILNQLKTVPTVAKKAEETFSDVTKENLEKFIIQYTSR